MFGLASRTKIRKVAVHADWRPDRGWGGRCETGRSSCIVGTCRSGLGFPLSSVSDSFRQDNYWLSKSFSRFQLEKFKVFLPKIHLLLKIWPIFRQTVETGMDPQLRSRSRTFFRTDCYTSHKNQKSETAVRRDLRFFVFIREDSKFNRLQVLSQRQHFLFSYFKDTLNVDPAGV